VEQSSGLHVVNLSKVSGQEMFRDAQYMVKTKVIFLWEYDISLHEIKIFGDVCETMGFSYQFLSSVV
jgi:hypothetical protein